MLKRFFCWLLGHKFLIETGSQVIGFGVERVKYRCLPFCFRCGCENNQYPKDFQE